MDIQFAIILTFVFVRLQVAVAEFDMDIEVVDDDQREHWRFSGKNFADFSSVLDRATSHFDSNYETDPASYRKLFANWTLSEVLHAVYHDSDVALAAIERQLTLVNQSLEHLTRTNRRIEAAWDAEVHQAINSTVDDEYFTLSHGRKGESYDQLQQHRPWGVIAAVRRLLRGDLSPTLYADKSKSTLITTVLDESVNISEVDEKPSDHVRAMAAKYQQSSTETSYRGLSKDGNSLHNRPVDHIGDNGASDVTTRKRSGRVYWVRRRRREAASCITSAETSNASVVTAYVPELTASIQLPCTSCDDSSREEHAAKTWFRFEHQLDGHNNALWVPTEVKLDKHDNPKQNRVFVLPDHTLVIMSVTEADRGVYVCHRTSEDSDNTFSQRAFRVTDVDQSSAITMATALSELLASRGASSQQQVDFISYVDTKVKKEPDIVSRSNMGDYRSPRQAQFSRDANVLVFTLWSSWAACTTCGRDEGERRRQGTCWVQKLDPSRPARPDYLDVVFRVYRHGAPCQSTVFADVPDIIKCSDEVEVAPCNQDCNAYTSALLGKTSSLFVDADLPGDVENDMEPHYEKWVSRSVGMFLEVKCPGTWNLVFRTNVAWFNSTANGSVAMNGLYLAERTKKRVEIDASQRLVFHTVKVEDTGTYSCAVDGKMVASYHVAVTVETTSYEDMQPYIEYLFLSYFCNWVVFASILLIRHFGRFHQTRAQRSMYAKRWADKELGRPDGVIKYLIEKQLKEHTDVYEEEELDENMNNSNNNNYYYYGSRRNKNNNSDRRKLTNERQFGASTTITKTRNIKRDFEVFAQSPIKLSVPTTTSRRDTSVDCDFDHDLNKPFPRSTSEFTEESDVTSAVESDTDSDSSESLSHIAASIEIPYSSSDSDIECDF